MLENFSDAETAKRAFNNAKELFLKGGPPRPATAQVWVKDVFVPLTKAGFGDPFDLPIVPNISEKKLRGTGDKDKTDRSPDERLHHYVLKALHGMLRD